MGIINGTFDTDLNGWANNNGEREAEIVWDSGRARLTKAGSGGVSGCTAPWMSQRFLIDDDILSFDWETYRSYDISENPNNWSLTVHTYDTSGNPMDITPFTEVLPSVRGNTSGRKIVDVSAYKGLNATLRFWNAYDGVCTQTWSVHRLWIDNVYVSPNWGVFDISSVPDGAEIWLDGNNTGYLTPKVIPEITLGDHIITIKKAGYYDYTTTISNVLPGRTYAISATLILKVGNLVLTTYPAGAKIFLSEKDGTVLNDTGFVTPGTFTNLPWGTYKWKVHLDFYKDESGTEIISTSSGAVVSKTLVPGGNISFVTSPIGASITIDGILQEGITTPAVIGVEDGSHTYILSLSGYQSIEGTIYVYLAQTLEVIKILSPLCTPNWQCEQPLNGYEADGCGNRRTNSACIPRGSISFSSVPSGAEIIIDGVDQLVATPATITEITGSHDYTLRKAGYNDYSGVITVSVDQTATVEVTLVPAEGCIYFNTTPAGAKIFIDDVDTGQVTPALICGLSLGPHTYRLSLTGYQDITGNVNLAAGQGTAVTGTLPKKGIGTGTIIGLGLLGAGILGAVVYVTREKKETAYIPPTRR